MVGEVFKVVVMVFLTDHMVRGTEMYHMVLGVDSDILHQRDHTVEGPPVCCYFL